MKVPLKKYFASNLKKYNNNQKGCTLSHISIWNKIKQNGYKYDNSNGR